MNNCVLGVDVGTGSVRAGLFDPAGRMLAMAVEPIQTWAPRLDHFEQSSADVWRAVCVVTRSCLTQSGVAAGAVAGIAFDATCSLVVLDADDQPLPVNDEGDASRNIIVWMNHRALAEADEITQTGHEVLNYVGGRMSPEMQTPKLKWLKRNLPQTWSRAARFFDLPDYLSYRACGVEARSLCTVVCKWTYLGHAGRAGKWDKTYFNEIDLADLLRPNKIGRDIRSLGSRLGTLNPQSAGELGLTTACTVGTSIIDAHAGGIGLLGTVWAGKGDTDAADLETALALIGGTSNCHMAVSREPRYIDGMWGPYFAAMIPGMWLTEGGQSTGGSAIDFVINDHANAPALKSLARRKRQTPYQLLNATIEQLQAEYGVGPELTRETHVLPYFLGNRSPHADPHARAVVEGLSLDQSQAAQALRYYACVQAVAYGSRDIIRALNKAGYNIQTMYVTGGGIKNPLWLREHADVTGCTLVLPEEPEAVLLGSAVLAAAAAGLHSDLPSAMRAMCRPGEIIRPRPETAAYHKAKYRVFRNLYKNQLKHRSLMGNASEQ